jgi:hypothetical protein
MDILEEHTGVDPGGEIGTGLTGNDEQRRVIDLADVHDAFDAPLPVETERLAGFSRRERGEILSENVSENEVAVGSRDAHDARGDWYNRFSLDHTALIDEGIRHRLALTAEESDENRQRRHRDGDERQPQQAEEEDFKPEVHGFSLFRG